MKRQSAFGMFSVLCLVILWTACSPPAWNEASVWGQGYKVHFEMPQPFRRNEEKLELHTGRTLYEKGWVTYGDEEHKFQIRVLET